MVPMLINKDMLEPNYNDLKFTVQNCDYVCTNLIALSPLQYSCLENLMDRGAW